MNFMLYTVDSGAEHNDYNEYSELLTLLLVLVYSRLSAGDTWCSIQATCTLLDLPGFPVWLILHRQSTWAHFCERSSVDKTCREEVSSRHPTLPSQPPSLQWGSENRNMAMELTINFLHCRWSPKASTRSFSAHQ
jgi:hypothetical protein